MAVRFLLSFGPTEQSPVRGRNPILFGAVEPPVTLNTEENQTS